MKEMLLNERITGANDWATWLFVACFALVAINRTAFEARFAEFIKLGVSDKYTKIYKDSSNLQSWFTISFFFIQVVSYSFLLQYVLKYKDFGLVEEGGISYVRIFTVVTFFILSKFLTEKIIATAFNIEEFNEQFNLHKVNYRAYIGLLLLPVNLVLFYNVAPGRLLLYLILGVILAATFISYLVSLRIYQKLILGKLFYFILYLCALEIAPYYFMYYWFTNS
ncbi:DUF4271 domain-containing protein [Flavobacterium sp. Sd200]|uniref:DUF4271 domain-containing protein n=1 Tax=Flavobacterium sp. Sd200 TaxID=2692211 RepID=UPI00144FDF8D|nr:DUF4271 domain-containing protein [Flavobacterium sp. Sd200]MXN92138.1 DUF4271 domain-containing protein [Flavobacterium sp. Sd200]